MDNRVVMKEVLELERAKLEIITGYTDNFKKVIGSNQDKLYIEIKDSYVDALNTINEQLKIMKSKLK